MRYQVKIIGTAPLVVHNGAAGLDTSDPRNIEKAKIAKKKASDRTAKDNSRIRELECQTSLYLDDSGRPTFIESGLRSVIEAAARKLKQGPQVREGLVVESVDKFEYDESMGTTAEELGVSAQFVTGVVVQRNRLLRTRAKFDEWAITFTVEADPELVDQQQLATWLDIAGRRLGIGDWRPQKSGRYGRFSLDSISPAD